jgi:sulfatase maturation enzyme AslB (radical SAM superfamily)
MKKVIPIEVENAICPQRWDFPYINMSRGEGKMCCLTSFYKFTPEDIEKYGSSCLTNNDYYKERRLEMLKGIRHSDCKFCWDLEDKNIESPRQSHSKINDRYAKTKKYLLDNWSEDIDINSDLLVSKSSVVLEVTLDATCDLKCMYCSPRYSTQWASEALKNKTISIEEYREVTALPTNEFTSLLWEWISSDEGRSLTDIRISGGEPLIIPEFYDMLEKLSEVRECDSKLGVAVVTNLNAREKYFNKLIELLPRLTDRFKFCITISMESTDIQAEYIRNGLDWDRFNNNVEELFKIASINDNMTLSFNPTINVLSIPKLSKFSNWIVELEERYSVKVSMNPHMIKSPACHSVFVLPSEFSRYVNDAIIVLENSPVQHPVYIKFLKSIRRQLEDNIPDINLQREFYDWFSNFDSLRGLNLVETFPELKDFYEYCKNIPKSQ